MFILHMGKGGLGRVNSIPPKLCFALSLTTPVIRLWHVISFVFVTTSSTLLRLITLSLVSVIVETLKLQLRQICGLSIDRVTP